MNDPIEFILWCCVALGALGVLFTIGVGIFLVMFFLRAWKEAA